MTTFYLSMCIYPYTYSDQQPCKKPKISSSIQFCGQYLQERSGTNQNTECPACERCISLPKFGVNALPSIMKPIGCLCSQPHREKEELKLLCETCQLLTCSDCTLILHKDHKIAEICNVAKVHRDATREALVWAEELTAKLTIAIEEIGKMAEKVENSNGNATLIITQAFEQLQQTIEERKKALLSEMEAISLSKTTALTLQKEQLMKMQDEIGHYTEMTSHILQSHTDHEMVTAIGDLLATELKSALGKVENSSFTPNESSDIHVSLNTDCLINELSKFGHVMDSPPSPSQSKWSSESAAKVMEMYCVKVESMTSKGERYPFGGLEVKAELSPLSHDGPFVPGEVVQDHGDGTYTTTLTPQNAGPHQLIITMDGQLVQNSPYNLDVRNTYSTLCNPDQVINCSGGPLGIAIDVNGDIYVVCGRDHSIHVFDQAGQQKRTIGSHGSGDCQFDSPSGIYIKGELMYIADSGNDRILNLTTGGQFLRKFGQNGSGQAEILCPTSVIVDQRDRLIISDNNNDRVVIMDQAGTWLLTINGNVTGNQVFVNPIALALDPQGNIHVGAWIPNTINVFTPEGTYVRSYGDECNLSGIVIDEKGYTLVTSSDDNRLSILDPQGNKIHTVGSLSGPGSVMLDPKSGSLYVANFGGDTIFKYSV